MLGRVRMVRGMVAGTVATGFALLFHFAAGGPMPGRPGLAATLTASVLVSVLLCHRRLALVGLGLSAAASQYLFHWLFVLGAQPAGTHARHHGHHAHHGHQSEHGHHGPQHGHHGAGPGDLGAHPVPALHDHGGDWMVLAHVAAAVLTTLVLYRGEVLGRRLLRWGEMALVQLLRRLPALAPGGGPARRLLIPAGPDVPGQQWRPGAWRARGPPAVHVLAA